MTFWALAAVFVSCLANLDAPSDCLHPATLAGGGLVAGSTAAEHTQTLAPVFTGSSLGVELSAAAALVWDEQTDTVLYEKNSRERREVASLSKLLSALAVREALPTSVSLEIPPAVRQIQRRGAHISLPPGEHATVYDLLRAGLIASANDAMTTLAFGMAADEEKFAEKANDFARRHGVVDTRISNATGLEGGEQYSTAADMRRLFQLAYRDQTLRNLLVGEKGTLTTLEGTRRSYTSTNELLGTYFPVLAAKTGYTPAAGQNLIIMTYGAAGQRIGAVVLGSDDRFQDMKALVEWVTRNYTWP